MKPIFKRFNDTTLDVVHRNLFPMVPDDRLLVGKGFKGTVVGSGRALVARIKQFGIPVCPIEVQFDLPGASASGNQVYRRGETAERDDGCRFVRYIDLTT